LLTHVFIACLYSYLQNWEAMGYPTGVRTYIGFRQFMLSRWVSNPIGSLADGVGYDGLKLDPFDLEKGIASTWDFAKKIVDLYPFGGM